MVESAGNAPASACLQGKCITCLPRPQKQENWQAALVLPQASGVLETLLHRLVRGLMGIGAAAGSCTRTSSVAGRHSAVKSQPQESKRAGSVLCHTPGPRHFNKEQTPLAIWSQIPTHGFTVVLSVFRGTPPAKPLDCKIRLNSSGAHL